VICTLEAAARSFNAFWTIWSAVSPARGAGVADLPDVADVADGPESPDRTDPGESQAAVERMITAARIPAGTTRMKDGTGVSLG
jgi:hypothetical protein